MFLVNELETEATSRLVQDLVLTVIVAIIVALVDNFLKQRYPDMPKLLRALILTGAFLVCGFIGIAIVM